MTKREEIFDYIKEKFNTVPDYPWFKHPNYAVLRHDGSNKWYGIVMNIPKSKLGLSGKGNVEVVNLKCDPELIILLIGVEGILPGYHMNKKHWITIVLDSPFPKKEICNLINFSYSLTK